jgi:hypothetical protein
VCEAVVREFTVQIITTILYSMDIYTVLAAERFQTQPAFHVHAFKLSSDALLFRPPPTAKLVPVY